jgi:hypothetical protein
VLQVPITLQVDADFRDIFEVRGLQRARRGLTVRSCSQKGWKPSTAASMAATEAPG